MGATLINIGAAVVIIASLLLFLRIRIVDRTSGAAAVDVTTGATVIIILSGLAAVALGLFIFKPPGT
jgi:hypothetical protein